MTKAKFMTAFAGIVGAAAVLTTGADLGSQEAESKTQAYCVKGSYSSCWGSYWGGWRDAYFGAGPTGKHYSIQ